MAMVQQNLHQNADEMLFVPEDDESANINKDEEVWRVLIVDDDEDVHLITALILKQCKIAGKSLVFMNAFSGGEAKTLLEDYQDQPFDLLLLDIVMEDDDSGFQVAQFLRKDLGTLSTKILIRTGQPGIQNKKHDLDGVRIDGFYLKTELSAARLREVVTKALTT